MQFHQMSAADSLMVSQYGRRAQELQNLCTEGLILEIYGYTSLAGSKCNMRLLRDSEWTYVCCETTVYKVIMNYNLNADAG